MNISDKKLKKLPKDIPTIINGIFDCHRNQLITLKGGPKEVSEDFYCYDNQLITLEGGPEKVGRDFYCDDNQLVTLEGGPEKVGRDFDCENNQLVTLEGGPEKVGGSFYCYKNPNLPLSEIIKFIFRCDIGGFIYSEYSDYDNELLDEINKNKNNKHKIMKLIFNK